MIDVSLSVPFAFHEIRSKHRRRGGGVESGAVRVAWRPANEANFSSRNRRRLKWKASEFYWVPFFFCSPGPGPAAQSTPFPRIIRNEKRTQWSRNSVVQRRRVDEQSDTAVSAAERSVVPAPPYPID